MKGSTFDIEEFAVYDGPGIRSVVFFKGCPLSCTWCHNPEGMKPGPQRITTQNLCQKCGTCNNVCPNGGQVCIGCGLCEKLCPAACIHIAGCPVEASEIAQKVLVNRDLLLMNNGGVTFSGGEPLMQPEFLLELRELLHPLHACIETSGYAPSDTFRKVISDMDYIIMDIKLADSERHKKFTGRDNKLILSNLETLKKSEKPFRIRIPLIPEINDSFANMEATASLLVEVKTLDKVELLPYHTAAGAKYRSAGMIYRPNFPAKKKPEIHPEPFIQRKIEVSVL